MTIEELRRRAARVAVGAVAAVLVACGGGGAGGQGEGPLSAQGTSGQASELPDVAGPAASKARLIQLVAKNSSTLPTDGRTPVELEAYVMDENNAGLPDEEVTFAAVDQVTPAGVRLELADRGKADSTGRASAKLLLLNNPMNRSVTVSAKVGALSSAPLLINVTGTSLAISGPSAITQGGSAEYTIGLRDSGGSPVASQALTVASKSGNAISAGKVTTDKSGKATVQVGGSVPGADTLTVSGAGTNAVYPLEVSDRSLVFAPGAPMQVPIGPAGGTFVLKYSELHGVPPNTFASLATTRGSILPGDRMDISSGTAAFKVSSQQAGPAKLTAMVGNVAATWPVTFYASTPSVINVQASPQIISANVGDSTDQRSSLYVIVRDEDGNPVANRRISLTTLQDPSGGIIEPGVVMTDASGRAEASFIAGRNVTAPNAVLVVARDVDASSVESSPASLTVSRRELFVRFHGDNKLEKTASAIYKKKFAVIVTDSAGNGIDKASIQAKIVPVGYREGQWTKGSPWTQSITAVFPSEDDAFDGFCSTFAEDTNRDGYLTPGNVAVVSGSSATGADGIAELVVSYPQGFAQWVEVILEVTGRSAGTESQSAMRFWLPILSDDIADENQEPPGVISPFPYPLVTASPYPGAPVPPFYGSCPTH